MASRQRRTFLRKAFCAAAVALGGSGGHGTRALAQAAAGSIGETRLRRGLLQLTGLGGNVVLAGGPSGVAIIDSGSAAHGKQMMRFVTERFGSARVDLLFNTHWHLDHTGGNEAVANAGATIVAHENTRLWMSTEFYVDWQDRTYSPRPDAARPTKTFYSSDPQPISIDHDGRRIEYGHLREAHTDGDIYVRFPEENVIVGGGAVAAGQYPVLDYITGGSIDGLIESTNKLLEMTDPETLIVPAEGAALESRHLEAQRDMLTTVRERMRNLARQGKGVTEMLADGITSDFDAQWGSNAERFLTNAYLSVWGIGR